MSTKLISHTVKALLGVLIVFVLLVMFYVLPLSAWQLSIHWSEIAFITIPVLLLAESMMAIFLAGLIIIIYLLWLFDKKQTFTTKFTQKIKILVALSVIVIVELIAIFLILASVGGPGPGESVLIVGAVLCIAILAAVLHLIAHIINEAILIREDNELTI